MILLIEQRECLEGPKKARVCCSDVDDRQSSKMVSVHNILGHVISKFHEGRAM
jgi:hypothetical protein